MQIKKLEDNKSSFQGFQTWIEQRYPFGRDRSWDKILHIINVSSTKMALEDFFKHWYLYKNNHSVNTLDPTTTEIIANIKKLQDRQ